METSCRLRIKLLHAEEKASTCLLKNVWDVRADENIEMVMDCTYNLSSLIDHPQYKSDSHPFTQHAVRHWHSAQVLPFFIIFNEIINLNLKDLTNTRLGWTGSLPFPMTLCSAAWEHDDISLLLASRHWQHNGSQWIRNGLSGPESQAPPRRLRSFPSDQGGSAAQNVVRSISIKNHYKLFQLILY